MPLKIFSPLRLPLLASVLGSFASLTIGCGSDAPPMGNAVVGRDSLPVMVTHGMSKLISDSGIIRYKLIAEEWRIFDKTTPPRWEFPKGIFIERFDDNFKANLHITADSAWLYNQKLWKLRGNIELQDKETQTYLNTQELYWNMSTGELSSDVHTRLIQPDQEIEGDWFRATIKNQQLMKYHIRQSKGFTPMSGLEDKPAETTTVTTDTISTDTLYQREGPTSRRKGS